MTMSWFPRQRGATQAQPARVPVCTRQALCDVSGYVGVPEETALAEWADVLRAWDAYLAGGRYGQDAVLDIWVMDTLVHDGAHALDELLAFWGG